MPLPRGSTTIERSGTPQNLTLDPCDGPIQHVKEFDLWQDIKTLPAVEQYARLSERYGPSGPFIDPQGDTYFFDTGFGTGSVHKASLNSGLVENAPVTFPEQLSPRLLTVQSIQEAVQLFRAWDDKEQQLLQRCIDNAPLMHPQDHPLQQSAPTTQYRLHPKPTLFGQGVQTQGLFPPRAFTLPGPPDMRINCTVVELSVFLPNLVRNNRRLAQRFIANGIAPGSQVMMMLEHCFSSPSHDSFSRLLFGINFAYKAGISYVGLREELEKVAEWERRCDAAQRSGDTFMEPKPHTPIQKLGIIYNINPGLVIPVPPGCGNAADISINKCFPVPTRNLPVLDGQQGWVVPFRELANIAQRFPQGPDAADLTRAVSYALLNQRRDPATGTHSEYLFPTHWNEILELTGRTRITRDHYDGACFQRYWAKYNAWANTNLPYPNIDPNIDAKVDTNVDTYMEGLALRLKV